jgi:tRNA wybutosine-synthesizing protein 3
MEKDKSPKGSIDPLIVPFMDLINQQNDFQTTSSCSGRISIFVEKTPANKGFWAFVSHGRIELDASTLGVHSLDTQTKEITENSKLFGTRNVIFKSNIDDLGAKGWPLVYFKFEPFILHVSASDNAKGTEFLQWAFNAGYRYSACVMGKNRCMVQIKSSLKLDSPIEYYDPATDSVYLIVDIEYLLLLVKICNKKFDLNEDRMGIFLNELKLRLSG